MPESVVKVPSVVAVDRASLPDASDPQADEGGLFGMLKRLGPAGPLAVAVSVLPPIGLVGLIAICSHTALVPFLRDNAVIGAPLYAVSFWLIGICLVPTNAYSILGGYSFGFWPGLLSVMVGYLGAALLSYWLMLQVSRDHVLPIVRTYPKLDAVRRALLEASNRRTILIIALLRVSPASPFAISNFALASSGVRWREFLLGTLVGMLPRAAAWVYIASTLSTLDLRSRDWRPFAGGLVATAVSLVVIMYFSRRELRRLGGQADSAR